MKIAVVKNDYEISNKVVQQVMEAMVDSKLVHDQENPDIVLSVGGDGTMIRAFHQYSSILDQIRFVGIHTGRLGFYTDWREYEVTDLIYSLENDQGQSISYPLLEVEVVRPSGSQVHIALNEAILRRTNGTLVCDVYLKGLLFERLRGDGLCFSTPTGSTGYNKSLGGAILNPRVEAFQMTEIAPINNRVYRSLDSPAILAHDEWATLKPKNDSGLQLEIDSTQEELYDVEEIHFRLSDQRIHFAEYQHTSFWKRVNRAFIGERG